MSERVEHPASGRRVLVVEDNPVNQRVVVALLLKWGHDVVVAENGAQALEVLARQACDLVLMDIQMPVMDGIEATCAIRDREREQGGHLPIVAVTAHAAAQDRERCLAAGADRYLTKPLNVELLRQAVAELLLAASPEVVAAPPAGAFPGIDFDQLMACVGDDPALLAEVVDMLLEEAPATLRKVGQAIADKAPPALEASAHRLKGSLSTMGARAAAETAFRLESMGREGSLAGATEGYARLRSEVDVACDALRQWMAQRRAA